MTTRPMNNREAAEAVHRALAHGLDGDNDAAIQQMTDVLTNTDRHLAYACAHGVAEAGLKALQTVFGDRAPDITKGEYWVLNQLGDGAGEDDPDSALFALRFLIAHCNDDRAMANALYMALESAGEMARLRGLGRLFCDVVGLLRSAEQHKVAQGR